MKIKQSLKFATLFLPFVLCLFFFACKSDTSSTADSQPDTPASDEPTHIKAEPSAILVGMWHFDIIVGKKEEKERYKGRWMFLKRDNTFTSGLWKEQTNQGTWTYDESTSNVSFKFEEQEDVASEWNVVGSESVVVWKGNTPSNPGATQIKMAKFLVDERPIE